MDGRDIGTVIFPDAPAKLFVTASPEARARRRHAELAARGVDRPLAEVEAEMRARDAQDAARATAPMQPADDAVLLDTTALGIEDAFATALAIVRARLSAETA
jgi:cytidylate kinase